MRLDHRRLDEIDPLVELRRALVRRTAAQFARVSGTCNVAPARQHVRAVGENKATVYMSMLRLRERLRERSDTDEERTTLSSFMFNFRDVCTASVRSVTHRCAHRRN